MKKEKKYDKIEKVKLTTNQILMYLVDGVVTAIQPFDRHQLYKKSFGDYEGWFNFDKKRFSDNIGRLEREGIIKIYMENNQGTIELSSKGKDRVSLILAKEYEYQYPEKWDGKWRIVIFDIPDKKKKNREIFREKLKEIGCFQLQESVFVFPFDFKEIVDYFKSVFMIRPCVQYIIANNIETEVNLLNIFLQRKILNKSMLKQKK